MKNYDIVSQDGLDNMVEMSGGKVIKLTPSSRNNITRKNGAAKTAQVSAEIKDAVEKGPKFKVVSFVIEGELNENVTPKKIKLNSNTFGKVKAKGKVEFKAAKVEEPVIPSMPVQEEVKPVVEEKKEVQEEVKTPDYSFPQFDFNSLKFSEPTPEPEDEKQTDANLSDAVTIPGYEEENKEVEPKEEVKAEEPAPVEEKVPEVAPVVEEKPVVEEEPKEEVKEELPKEKEVKAEEEKPVVEEEKEEVKVEAPVEEEKQEEVKEVDKTVEFNADNLREALKAKLNAVEKETQERNEKELEEARKAKEAVEKKLAAKEKELEEKERKLDETSAALAELQEKVSEITKAASKHEKELEAYKEVFSELVETSEPAMKRAA